MISNMSDYNYPKPINTPMKLRDILRIHEDDGGGASAGATTSADIAGVSYPLFVRGRTRKDKRKNARAAVGQKSDSAPNYIGRGVFGEMAASSSGGGTPGPGPGGDPGGDPPADPSTPVAPSTGKIGQKPPGGGQGLSQQGDLPPGKGGIFLGHQDPQEPHNFSAKAQVGQGIEWPKPTAVPQTANVKQDEMEMPGDHHVVGHHGDHHANGVSEGLKK